jgi:hypothetical protein
MVYTHKKTHFQTTTAKNLNILPRKTFLQKSVLRRRIDYQKYNSDQKIMVYFTPKKTNHGMLFSKL